MTTISPSKPSNPRDLTPYSEQELREALLSLAKSSTSNDTRHISFDGTSPIATTPASSEIPPTLSMLNLITATRILDYRKNQKDDDNTKLLQELEAQAKAQQVKNGNVLNLQTVIQREAPRMALAAEFKRASPSKGIMAPLGTNAGDKAVQYTKAGANIISVLTEERWFQGSLDDLTQVRTQTANYVQLSAADKPKSRPAILRKDFCFNKVMIAQAVAAGADTILLIVAVLPQNVLADLIDYARANFGMEPLVEVHADIELQVALDAGAKVIGVNNRNLHTFQMDLSTSERVAQQLQDRGLEFRHTAESPAYTLCALSGMSTSFDVDRYRKVGLGMCLIGESLMRATDPVAAIASLCLDPQDFARQSQASAGSSYTANTQIVKVCGITNSEDALVACQAGANLIGVIFAAKSKRKVTAEQAKSVVQAVQSFGERNKPIEWGKVYPPKTGEGLPFAALPHLVSSSRVLVEATRRPAVVGVFQNQETDFIRQMVQECELDLVQLHGSEGMAAANIEVHGVPAIRVVDISVDPQTGKASDNAVDTILANVTNDPIAILLDTSIKGQKEGGGTGVSFDWGIAERVQNAGLPVVIAGGLTAESVRDCVGSTRPFGVDVSSGVEQEPGRKDHGKVQSFVRGAREAAQEASKGF